MLFSEDAVLIDISFARSPLSLQLSRQVYCFTDALISTTATNVSGHACVNIGVCRMWIIPQQYSSRHNLPRMAIATLRHLLFIPSQLCRMIVILRQPFYSRNLLPFGAA